MQSRPKERSPHKIFSAVYFLILFLVVGCASAKANHHDYGVGAKLLLPLSASPSLDNLGSKWRGGAAATARSLSKKRSLQPDAFETQKHQLPSVQAILVHRRINLLKLLQLASLTSLLCSLVACVLTAGTPLIESIWLELHEGNMPVDYKPSNWEIIITRHLTLPLPFLPSVKPLLGLLSSLLMYVGLGLLLPKWFASSYKRQLEFRQVGIQKDGLSTLLSRPAAVLVQIPREMQVYTDNKALLVCPLKYTDQNEYYFDLCHQRYYVSANSTNATVVFGGPPLVNAPIKSLLKERGLYGAKLRRATSQFQVYNHFQLPTPTITQAFLARLASPLVVLQLFGKLLAALEDPSLFHTAMSCVLTLLHHYWDARQSIVSARELAQEVQRQDSQTLSVKVKRGGNKKTKKWTSLNASELLPGDVFQLQGRRATTPLTIPVDALLLRGSAVTNEAVLTGESVAQSKVAMEESANDNENDNNNENLDMLGRHRASILFAGTTLVHCPTPITLLALRTGSYSSRGDLLRALQRSRVGAVSNIQSERDGLSLMASMGVAACLSCTWYCRSADAKVSVFRKVLQCSRIILAALPSDLPLTLSSIADSCAMKLKREADVVCSEPGALLTASTIDHVLFDKTGTICGDTQAMSHVVNGTTSTDLVLAGSNSLVLVDEALVGDPLDKASLSASGWTLNKTNGSYQKDGSTLWQIKTFPFDANRRTSSSIGLVHEEHGGARLCSLVKGSPDAILKLVSSVDKDRFRDTVVQLGQDGYRIIAIAIEDIGENSTLFESIFPSGFQNTTSIEKAVAMARKRTQTSLHRDSVETVATFEFCGFACFEASVRPSSPRVIKELLHAQVGVAMLTGDGVDVAIAVARRCQIISDLDRIALLDYDSEAEGLVWTEVGKGKGSAGSRLSTRKVLSSKKPFTIVATGNAVEALSKSSCSEEEKLIRSRMQDFSVFARATPSQKVLVVSTLKQSGKKVIMCGDGVNDVAAMKVADCGVALLNGFADVAVAAPGNTIVDLEDERRRQIVSEKRIGSQRRMRSVTGNTQLGKSGRAHRQRVKALIDKELLSIKTKAAERQGLSDPESRAIGLSLDEIREMFAAIGRIYKAENTRAKLLRKGGAAAAKILAEADRNATGQNGSELAVVQDIKPGEASLVSPFSCLRPAIDGVESILRYSVAVASFAQVTHKAIALNCLTYAFNLATMPTRGLRYGKFMWNVELALYVYAEQAATHAACTPRPRLSSKRPPVSFFHPFSIMTVLAQFIVHACTRTAGLRIASRLEAAFMEPRANRRLICAAPTSLDSVGEKKPMMLLLMESLLKAPVEVSQDKEIPAIVKMFQRAPFRPNYPTNLAFLLSVFQPAVSTLMNHRGRPFHGAILEHRQLIIGIGLAILFPLCMLTEGFKSINKLLELRLLPTTRSQLCLMSVFGIDFVASYLITAVCKIGQGDEGQCDKDSQINEKGEVPSTGPSAAEREEELLEEEAQENGALVRIMTSAVGMIFLSSLAKTLEASANI
ncbi:calcium-transporting ATPase [Fragilaria crotonensis]|nr:calcium-transporting ATPase [Fragilaria crotonensis]